ncbi:MAG: exopolyphosphatase [Candidatus Eremiobacteraeota bacterium]|nr:exopolyphosphatase [Candidatus Eremiobacteraeota bacterium]
MTRAVISLGTNTARLLVVRERSGGGLEQLDARQTGTRLGEGLRDDGALAPAAMERTLTAAREFVEVARGHEAGLAAIATSAVRRASNAREFAASMREVTGVELQVLSGRAEAEASFRGATYGSATMELTAVVDVGGGSTECAIGRAHLVETVRSVEIGSVRVAERFPDLMGAAPGPGARAAATSARRFIAESLAPLRELPRPQKTICVAGTPLTIAAILLESHVDRASGTVLSRAELDATIRRLLSLNLAARRALPGMLAQRADILAAGALILSETLDVLGAESASCEANDLLLGFLLEQPPEAAVAK